MRTDLACEESELVKIQPLKRNEFNLPGHGDTPGDLRIPATRPANPTTFHSYTLSRGLTQQATSTVAILCDTDESLRGLVLRHQEKARQC